MGSWGKYNPGDSEDGGTSPEGRVAHARASPQPPLSTTVPGLSQTFSWSLRVSAACKMMLVRNGETRLRAELQQLLPHTSHVLKLSPPFSSTCKVMRSLGTQGKKAA